MAIKMRNNKDPNSVCCECGDHRKDVLGMYDMRIGGQIITFCDVCNEQIMDKTLKAEVDKNHRTKTPHDMAIMRRRANGSYKNKWYLKHEKERQAAEKKYHDKGGEVDARDE